METAFCFLGSITLNKQVDKHQLSISFEPRTKFKQTQKQLTFLTYKQVYVL